MLEGRRGCARGHRIASPGEVDGHEALAREAAFDKDRRKPWSTAVRSEGTSSRGALPLAKPDAVQDEPKSRTTGASRGWTSTDSCHDSSGSPRRTVALACAVTRWRNSTLSWTRRSQSPTYGHRRRHCRSRRASSFQWFRPVSPTICSLTQPASLSSSDDDTDGCFPITLPSTTARSRCAG